MIKHKIPDLIYQADSNGYALTRFLDFEEQKEINACHNNDLDIILFGGSLDTERNRAIIYQKHLEVDESLFEITILQSHYDKKFSHITHRHVLGTIMALGIERNLIGDIFIDDEHITVMVCADMADYIIKNVIEILHDRISFKVIDHFNPSNMKDVDKIINVPSLRLDAVISKTLNISRNDAVELIEAGSVLINHVECLNISKTLKENDILSIRKFGRVTIKEVVNTSKKDRLNLKVGIKH